MRRNALVGLAALAACSLTTEPLDRVEVLLSVGPEVAQAGDSVEFAVVATNPTDESITLGTGVDCGPPFDVRVERPDGGRHSVVQDVFGDAAFLCILTPDLVLDPGETQVFRVRWATPDAPGRYRAVAGLRRDTGLGNTSPPAHFSVR